MRYGLTPQTPLVVGDLPVTVAEAKAWLNVSHSEDDTMIGDVLLAVAESVERVTGLSFAARSFVYTATLPAFGGAVYVPRGSIRGPFYAGGAAALAVDLPRRPVASVDAVSWTDAAGAATVLAAGDDYALGPTGRVALADGLALPAGSTLTVAFTTAAATVPPEIAVVLRRAIAVHYEYRSDAVDQSGGNVVRLPQGALDLLLPHREVTA